MNHPYEYCVERVGQVCYLVFKSVLKETPPATVQAVYCAQSVISVVYIWQRGASGVKQEDQQLKTNMKDQC